MSSVSRSTAANLPKHLVTRSNRTSGEFAGSVHGAKSPFNPAAFGPRVVPARSAIYVFALLSSPSLVFGQRSAHGVAPAGPFALTRCPIEARLEAPVELPGRGEAVDVRADPRRAASQIS